MADGRDKIDLSQLCIPVSEIKNLLAHLMTLGNKKRFFELIDAETYEREKGSDLSINLKMAKSKVQTNRLGNLSTDDCLHLKKYLVSALGGRFLELYGSIVANHLKKSIARLRPGIIAKGNHRELEQLESAKIASFFQRLNKEALLRWVYFLDNLPSASKDETEESEVRESAENIIECFLKVTIREERLKANDWRILKSSMLYFGASHFFMKGGKLPKDTYNGILPYSIDSLTKGFSRSTRDAFIKKAVEERLSTIRPPVIEKNALKPFLLDGQKNQPILDSLMKYYNNLKADIKKRRASLKIFSVYYETLVDAIKAGGSGDDRMLRPAYIDSIYYAINFEDFRNLNEDGFGVDLHTKGKWIRGLTAKHIGIKMHPLLLEPVRNLRTAINKGHVGVVVALPEAIIESVEEEAGHDEEIAEPDALIDGMPEDIDIPVEERGKPVLTAVPPMGMVREVEFAGEAQPEKAAEAESEERILEPPPILAPDVISANRDSHVLPINEGNISVALIGNKPQGSFIVGEKNGEET